MGTGHTARSSSVNTALGARNQLRKSTTLTSEARRSAQLKERARWASNSSISFLDRMRSERKGISASSRNHHRRPLPLRIAWCGIALLLRPIILLLGTALELGAYFSCFLPQGWQKVSPPSVPNITFIFPTLSIFFVSVLTLPFFVALRTRSIELSSLLLYFWTFAIPKCPSFLCFSSFSFIGFLWESLMKTWCDVSSFIFTVIGHVA